MPQTNLPNLSPEGKKDNLLSTILIALILATLITVISGFIGFGAQGFDISGVLQQFTVYVAFGIGSLFGVLLLEVYFRTVKDESLTTFFNSPRFKFLKNPLQLMILSLILFSILGLVATFYHQTFLGVGTLQEQFTRVDGIVYNWTLVVTSENLGAALFAGLGVLFLYLAKKKWNWQGNNFKYLSIMWVVLSFIFYGFILHQLRYSGSEPDLLKVLVFWGMGGILTAVTGSVIPFLIAHGMNNTFVELAPKTANEASFIIPVVIFIIVMVVIYALLFIRRKKPK
jgi:hypothetical protein